MTRILIAVSSLAGGGAERTAATLARYWRDHGHDVRIVTLWGRFDSDYPLPDRVSHVALDLAHGGGSPLRRLAGNLRAVAAYRREIKRFRPEAAVGMMTTTNVVLALAAFGLGCTVIGSERSSPANSPLSRFWSVMRRFAYALLDGVTAQTEGAAAWLRRNTLARRVTVIPNSVSLPIPHGSPALAPDDVCPAGTKVLLGVGRLAPVKQFELLIEAFAQVAPARHDWTLVLLGEGPERGRLAALVERGGLQGRVLTPGRAGNMSDWYERAALIALTSHHEGFPNVLLEAMAHGVPAISVDCPDGPRAIVRDGVDGLLVAPGDVDAFSRALDRLMGDADARGRMGHAAREVLERFSERSVMQLWDDALGLGADRRATAATAGPDRG